MMVMSVPAVITKLVPGPPEAGVCIAMTVWPVVVGLVVDARFVVRARFDVDGGCLMVVVPFNDASPFDHARRRVLVPTKVC